MIRRVPLPVIDGPIVAARRRQIASCRRKLTATNYRAATIFNISDGGLQLSRLNTLTMSQSFARGERIKCAPTAANYGDSTSVTSLSQITKELCGVKLFAKRR
jgi:hypothetical protein